MEKIDFKFENLAKELTVGTDEYFRFRSWLSMKSYRSKRMRITTIKPEYIREYLNEYRNESGLATEQKQQLKNGK